MPPRWNHRNFAKVKKQCHHFATIIFWNMPPKCHYSATILPLLLNYQFLGKITFYEFLHDSTLVGVSCPLFFRERKSYFCYRRSGSGAAGKISFKRLYGFVGLGVIFKKRHKSNCRLYCGFFLKSRNIEETGKMKKC